MLETLTTLWETITTAAKRHSTLLYATGILLVVVLATSSDPTPRKRNYIPKSKRWNKLRSLTRWATTVGRQAFVTIENSLQNGSLSPRHQRIKKVRKAMRGINRPTSRLATACAFSTILAMNAEHSRPQGRGVIFDLDSKPIGVDNRCSACISHRPEDFIGELQDCKRTIKAFGGTRSFDVKIGTLQWTWEDDDGRVHLFVIPKSYYVPGGNVRLLSPQHWAKHQQDTKPFIGTRSITSHETVTLQWGQRQYKRTIPLDKGTNVATFRLAPGYKTFSVFCAEAGLDSDTNDADPLMVNETHFISEDEPEPGTERPDGNQPNPWENQLATDNPTPTPTPFDLDMTNAKTTTHHGIPIVEDDEDLPKQYTTDEALLLHYHHKFGHVSFNRLKQMAKTGVIPKRLAKVQTPVCAACLCAKATKRQWRTKCQTAYKPHTATEPGEVVSVDQLVSPTPGLIAQMTGILTIKRYKYATVYVDQASRLGYVYLQKTATAQETIESKHAFETYAKDRGVKIQHYHADNGIFRANLWQAECKKSNQGLTFAGVNAHHTNGLAEKRIRDLQDLARTQMIHATSKWPACITANLWPYAVRLANDTLNNTPSPQDSARRTAEQIFAKTVTNINEKHYHPFGCPCYVLNEALQKNNPHNKWKGRTRVGIYLGRSPQHGRNVALVLDRSTGLVSPQFHVQYDPTFSTTQQCKFSSQWQLKAGFIGKKAIPAPTPLPQVRFHANTPTTSTFMSASEGGTNSRGRSEGATQQPQTPKRKQSDRPQPKENLKRAKTSQPHENKKSPPVPHIPQDVSPGQDGKTQPTLIETALTEIENTEHGVDGEIFCFSTLCPDGIITTDYDEPLYVYKSTADPDTLYHHEAMKQTDKREFQQAMQKEIDDRMNDNNYSIIKRSDVPKGASILPAVWQLRRKRDIKTRQIKKYKARLNIDGSRMKKGIHYDQTYAPVASWNTIRTLLTLTAVNGWHTKQLDYVAAFPQAPVERELYMKIPKGVTIGHGNNDDYVLKLHKNMYGQKNAGRVWNTYLVNKLTKIGFVQSNVDKCLFYHGKVMYVLYTDDSILAGPDEKEIDNVIAKMRKAKLDITIEGTLEDFLGVNIDRKDDGTIHLTQPHLIDSILRDLNLDDDKVKTKTIPACSSRILKKHQDSEPFDKSFNYRSVIGKLNYLERGSRSDIAYITHQCARYTENPKKEHGQALRWLGRYLKETRDKGTILCPNKDKNLEVYVDADFAGNFDREDTQDRDTARSRHGYILMLHGCPLTWKSQLQTEITLSSTESEYTGLSYALREAIPIMQTLTEMKKKGFPVGNKTPIVKCEVFEDNSGALEIATNHKFRPRTKHLNVKLHHFRDYVTRGEIQIAKIDTTKQLADYLTKPVNEDILTRLRRQVMGW